MALIIETGTGDNPTANSYETVESLREWGSLRGVDLSGLSDAECEVLMIKAMDYLEAQKAKYKGHKTEKDQPLQWPRNGVTGIDIPYARFPNNEIPRELKQAQLNLALEAIHNELMPNTVPDPKGTVIREKVGPIELQYEPRTEKLIPAFAKVDVLMIDLFKKNGLTLIRS